MKNLNGLSLYYLFCCCPTCGVETDDGEDCSECLELWEQIEKEQDLEYEFCKDTI